jgi:hypothetical protein
LFLFLKKKKKKKKNAIFWVGTLSRPMEVHRRFGGAYSLSLQDLRVSEARNLERQALFVLGFSRCTPLP